MASVHVDRLAGRVELPAGNLEPVVAVSLAKQSSTGPRAVVLCEEKSFARAFRDGRTVSSLVAGKRTKISQWMKAGADAAALKDLDGAAADDIEIIGDALGIPIDRLRNARRTVSRRFASSGDRS